MKGNRCNCLGQAVFFTVSASMMMFHSNIVHAEPAVVSFKEVAEQAGLVFKHENGMEGELWLVEIIGSGVGVLDFDNDGLLDIWLVQGGPLRGRSGTLPNDRLFKNTSQKRQLMFEDVTESTGVVATQYGMGIATGDIDNDGDLDVFLANYGKNQLFENLNDGTFRDITERARFTHEDWSVAGSFADVDNDGWLDLYVANYVDFSLSNHKSCMGISQRADYCSPESYEPQSDRLFRNLGSGRFEEITSASGIEGAYGGALGVIAADFNQDGHVDFYVANDPVKNLLWMNQGDATFTENALSAGVAVNGNGQSEASMGLDVADFDQDCDLDLFMTNLTAETNTLFIGDGAGWFVDKTSKWGLASSSNPFTGFGTAWVDVENDGDLDLFSVNGAVSTIDRQQQRGDSHPFRQRNQLWLNESSESYAEWRVDQTFEQIDVSRGLATGDLDNDGDIDLVVTNNDGSAKLYENRSAENAWLGLNVNGVGRHVTGSEVRLIADNCRMRVVRSDGSYASANDPRIVFGLGADTEESMISVTWPDGVVEIFGPLTSNRYHGIERSQGIEQ